MSENRKQKRSNQSDNTKTELANRIANQSRKVASSYQHLEDSVLRTIRWFSTVLDRTLFNRRYTKIISLVLAIMMYFIVNYDANSGFYTSTLKTSKDKTGVSVTAKYNSDTFEISGLPTTANITISGDATNVTAAANSKGTVVADLEGLTEGQHNIKLTTEGFGENVDVKIDPSNVIVTLKKKTTRQFDITYDFINLDKMDARFSPGTPTFEYEKVNVRGSKETLDSIAFVKVLIDVKEQVAEFEQEAIPVAYNASGQPVNVDIVPSTVKVKVPVTSPNKTVPIEVQVTGELPEGKSILSIQTDQQTVTIFGPEQTLGQINKVVVTLSTSAITKDESTILRPITLPTGINSSNINQITMNVKLADEATRVIDVVKINYRNNNNNYKASQPENKTTTSVTVRGAEDNIKNITADMINVYINMQDVKPGLQNFQLEVEQPTGGLVKYELTESTYQLNVLGETNQTQENQQTGVNNG